jgi:nitrite reductase/ring-hydroxylating ferredoxin subunit
MTAPTHWHQLPNAPAPGTLLGSLQELDDGAPAMRTLPAAAESTEPADKPFRYLLLRSGGEVIAYVNRCAHFGVPLAAKQEQLIFQPHQSLSCNVHYARYRWADGVCESGECEGESLLAIPVVVDAQGRIGIAP